MPDEPTVASTPISFLARSAVAALMRNTVLEPSIETEPPSACFFEQAVPVAARARRDTQAVIVRIWEAP